MKAAPIIASLAAVLLASATRAEPAVAPIRIWGTPALLGVAEAWATAYRKAHPDARIEFHMKGSDSAIHGLTGGVADVALLGRENDIVDDNGFSRPKEYAATRIEIATGSLSEPGKSDAIAVLVARDNPIRSLTLDQLSRILDCGDQPRAITTWGQLGAGGSWRHGPIRIHSYDLATRTGAWLQKRVTGNDRRMCWDRIVEYRDRHRLDGTVAKAADRIGEGARGDRFALAIANPAQAVDGLKLVALADGDGEAVSPTRDSVAARRYPLARRAFAFLARKPGAPLAPHVLAFLRFVLSEQGQMLVAETGYLPLSRDIARAQLGKLEDVR
ncbi:MAG: hypothetical protein JWN21_344 [Sphingomonas bacterium]|uniref:PstS family phosphate ABC transporter substrate-binding protein n=1 Tax=Sphingomonas bacterium TaxID=1895847 RepID=UPI0026063AA5|nr:substrate-binding domain-containing protein [Sphingomonas bacterium]MDB5694801.1 hypothetical protein [Sphingomonas bacterium]